MKKGDCILVNGGDLKYLLILHHTIENEQKIEHGFIIVGNSFQNPPTKKEIELCGIFGI